MFSFLEFKVRLSGRYEKHTGFIGAYEFNQGVSVNKLHRREAEMLAAIGLHGVAIDDNGDDVFVLKVGQIPAPDASVEEVRKTSVTHKKSKSISAAPETVAKIDAEPEAENVPKSTYTREQLEAIADKSGLRGLREIADEMGVKGKSIKELIDRILKG